MMPSAGEGPAKCSIGFGAIRFLPPFLSLETRRPRITMPATEGQEGPGADSAGYWALKLKEGLDGHHAIHGASQVNDVVD